jgi:hypothetical protein
MARQFREQLEEEVQLEEARRARAAQSAAPANRSEPAADPPPAHLAAAPHTHPTDTIGADPDERT